MHHEIVINILIHKVVSERDRKSERGR